MAVGRTDSVRSDVSSRPRVSFNRDVHVKRIGGRGAVSGLTADSSGRFHPTTLRREPSFHEDPRAVLAQAEKTVCSYSTLPTRGNKSSSNHVGGRSAPLGSLERRRKETKRPEAQPKSAEAPRTRQNRLKLSPIFEKETPMEPPSDRIMKLINGSQPPQPPPLPTPKKKETLGQRMRHLFTKKKKKNDDPLQRYTQFTGTENRNSEARRDSDQTKNSWFRSMDRLKGRSNKGSWTDDQMDSSRTHNGGKVLRFFGDSESEGEAGSEAPSSLHSHKSVVYLHSTTVGDIPDLRRASKEDLRPYRKTLSRSVSVLAPWGVRHPPSGKEVDYSTLGRPPAGPNSQRSRHRPPDLLFTGPSFDHSFPIKPNKSRI